MASAPSNPALPPQPQTAAADGWTRRRHALCWAGLLALYLFLSTYCLSRVPLLDPDEPRYATAARTMAQGGSWLIPEFNEEARYNKPPLFYWLVALSHKAFGPSEVSARIPSIVMGLLMLILTVYAAQRLYDTKTGYVGGLVLCTSPLFMALSRTCVIDQTLSTILTAGLFLFLLRLAGRLTWNPLWVIGALMGLAFMAKGPAATLILVVPLLFVILFAYKPLLRSPGVLWVGLWIFVAAIGLGWLAVQKAMGTPGAKPPSWAMAGIVMAGFSTLYYGLRRLFTFPAWLGALLLAGFLSVWWYLALWNHIGGEKFLGLLKFEILGRLQGSVHKEPYAFYAYIFPAVFFPWSIALVAAIATACRKVDLPMPLKADEEEQTVCSRRLLSDAFLVAWLAGVVLFFTIPVAKLATYVLPAFPAAALLTARFLGRLQSATEPIHKGWLIFTGVFGALVGLGFVSIPLFENLFKKDAQETIQNLPVPLWALGLGVGILFGVPWIVTAWTRRSRVALIALPTAVVLLVAVALPIVFGRSAFLNISRTLGSRHDVQAYAHRAKAVYSIGWPEESLVWYLGRGVHGPLKGNRDPKEPLGVSFQKALDEHPPGTVLLFAHSKKLKRLCDISQLVRVRKIAEFDRVWVLVNEDGPTLTSAPVTEPSR